MSILKIKSKLNNLEAFAFKMLNVIFSAFIGYLFSKTGIISSFSPFTISFLSISPITAFSVIATYCGMFAGYITNGFSVLNFKYICANTIVLVLILITGRKAYLKNLYTPVLPGAVCLSVGTLFLFADDFSIYAFLLVVCESILCSCAAYFMSYFISGIIKKNKMDIKDLISVNITLIILLCALDSFYILGFSVSAIFLQILIYLASYYMERKTSAIFTLSLCFIISLLHFENTNYFLYFYIPALISIIISKIEKKHIVLTYFISQATVISFTGISFYSIKMIVTPLISGILYSFIPKKKLSELLSNYINIADEEKETQSNNELCVQYCLSADKISQNVTECSVAPILNVEKISLFKKELKKLKCKNIEITNFYNSQGKQILSVTCENEKKINFSSALEKLNYITGSNFRLKEDKSDGNIYCWKFEYCNNYRLECHALYKAKCGENICGDNASAFKVSENNYYIIVADGMGSGKDAYTKSFDTINILKKLLKLGVDPTTAIKTANSSISMLKDEIGFSTIDLCCISLETGIADFYKCGAYMTLILRNNTLIRIKENGFPVGLNSQIDPERQTVCLHDGDIIIMMSDGVSNAIEKIESSVLTNDCNSTESLTRKLIECATDNTAVDLDDDMTVVVSKFTKNRNNEFCSRQ